MKELSIEEKAKRYDEAVNEIKNLRDMLLKEGVINKNGVIWDNFNRIFPELKESEDERIRKALIKLVKKAGEGYENVIDGVSIEDAISWLEKQAEQKPVVNDNAKEMFIKALECVEEQNNKGYKLTDCDKNSWWEDFKAYTSCTIEQKPAAWSDEDEK